MQNTGIGLHRWAPVTYGSGRNGLDFSYRGKIMVIHVLKWEPNGTMKGTVIIEGDTFSDVSSTEAKQAAIAEAQKHLGLCGISGQSGPYPVDENGKELTDALQMNELIKQGRGYKYRNDYSITQSLAL
jgi:hypothetical protein